MNECLLGETVESYLWGRSLRSSSTLCTPLEAPDNPPANSHEVEANRESLIWLATSWPNYSWFRLKGQQLKLKRAAEVVTKSKSLQRPGGSWLSVMVGSKGSEFRKTWVQVLSLLLSGYETLSRSLSLPSLSFPFSLWRRIEMPEIMSDWLIIAAQWISLSSPWARTHSSPMGEVNVFPTPTIPEPF